jgi:single-stranded-DNA-specific exonuclease
MIKPGDYKRPNRPIRRRLSAAQESQLPQDIHPVLRRIYAQRGIDSLDQLDVALSRMHPANLLGGTAAAVALLERVLEERQSILVIGDFDADGATSTALALRALRAMGAVNVRYLVPNRFEFGYGLTPEIVEVAVAHQPDLIITVDNGVASIEGVDLARAYGIKVMITDHHLPGDRLPNADVIVNPNLKNDPFPCKSLAGVGVIYYVMLALRAHLRQQGWFERNAIHEPNMAQFLDLVAVGTVADVVPLVHNNRILVEQGLRRIRAGRCLPGITALMQVAGRDVRSVVAADLGFAVGPRLNAAGRLVDMSRGIECLLTDDLEQARDIARELDQLNRQRRSIENQMQSEALEMLEQVGNELMVPELPYGLCLYDYRWHQGVIGILASRIKDRFHRPVIAFADAGSGEIKGSARSISGLHIRDLLEEIAVESSGLINKFGGHAMAAGLTLPLDQLATFRQAFERAAQRALSKEHLDGAIYTDGELTSADLNLELAELLRKAGPWGQGFPVPEFEGVFEVAEQRLIAGRHLKLRLKPGEQKTGEDLNKRSTSLVDAIAFNIETLYGSEDLDTIHIVYRLEVNSYLGDSRPQLVITCLQPVFDP